MLWIFFTLTMLYNYFMYFFFKLIEESTYVIPLLVFNFMFHFLSKKKKKTSCSTNLEYSICHFSFCSYFKAWLLFFVWIWEPKRGYLTVIGCVAYIVIVRVYSRILIIKHKICFHLRKWHFLTIKKKKKKMTFSS